MTGLRCMVFKEMLARLPGYQDSRDRHPPAVQFVDNLQAGHFRHHLVQDQAVESPGGDKRKKFGPGPEGLDGVTRILKIGLQHVIEHSRRHQ